MSAAVLDPHQKIILDRIRALPAVDMRALPIAVARQTFEDNQRPWVHCPVPTGATTDLSLPGPAGPIRARLYRPAGDPVAEVPLVVFVHGGGWTFGSVDTHDGTARTIAGFSGCAVLSIDYRLAPEHPFPAPLDDVLAAIAFARTGGLGDGIDAGRMALAGDSAGANLALGAVLALRDRGLSMPLTAALFYGCFAPIFDTQSHARFGDGSFLLGSANMRWYWANFLGNDDFATPPPLAAPLNADLAGLPPLYLNAAGLDPLLDDTLMASARLAAAGVRHRLDVWPGVVHGFLRLARELPTAVAALAAAGDHLRSALNQKT